MASRDSVAGVSVISISSSSSDDEKYEMLRQAFRSKKVLLALDDLWDELAGLMTTIGAINSIKQRVAVMENDLKYINRDHNGMVGGR